MLGHWRAFVLMPAPGLWSDCATDAPIAPGVNASAYYIAPIDNGCTFVNTGANIAWGWYLPPAIPGMCYRFSQFVSQIWQIKPVSGEGINGQAQNLLPSESGRRIPGAGLPQAPCLGNRGITRHMELLMAWDLPASRQRIA